MTEPHTDSPRSDDGAQLYPSETVAFGSQALTANPGGFAPMPDGGEVQQVQSGWRLAVREFTDNRLAVASVLIIVFFILFSFLGPLVYHTNQHTTNLALSDIGPSGGHIFGTDDNGFDELGRIMLGGQTALEVGFFSSFVAIVIGTIYGAVSGLVGRWVDGVMMRFVDIMLSIPFLFLILILANKYGATVPSMSLLLGLFSWLVPARLVRGEVLTLRERDFVWAARVMGAGNRRIIWRHLIPNAVSVTIVNVTFLLADAILALAYLGFLGYGLQYPATSWGDMLENAQNYVQAGEWWLVYPVGGALVLLVLAFNLVGDGLRDALDIRLRRR